MIDDGGQAFPRAGNEWASDGGSEGMTLRDYFAAAAASSVAGGVAVGAFKALEAAEWAYAVADAMLAVRLKSTGN